MNRIPFTLLILVIFCMPNTTFSNSILKENVIIGVSYPIQKKILRFIKKQEPKGIILTGRGFSKAKTTKETITMLNTLKEGYSPLISIDQEGGRVVRIKHGVSKFPSFLKIAQSNSIPYAEHLAYKRGKELKDLGIDMIFGPVLDVNTVTSNPVIGDRSFGSDPSVVSKFGRSTLKGLKRSGVIPVAKHFPGHGHTTKDSHKALPIVKLSKAELRAIHISPFADAMFDGLPAIMISHVVYTEFDSVNPASLSTIIMTNLLRNELKYDGLIITDDLMMDAINRNIPIHQAVQQAINAGADLAIVIGTINDYKRLITLAP
jgi:beta-N-acetylhexosaminidase